MSSVGAIPNQDGGVPVAAADSHSPTYSVTDQDGGARSSRIVPIVDSAQDGNNNIRSRRACRECMRKKVKCQRQQPTCSRCERSGRECVYPTTRSRPSRTTSAREGSSSPPVVGSPEFDGARYSPPAELSASDANSMKVLGHNWETHTYAEFEAGDAWKQYWGFDKYEHRRLSQGEVRLLCVHASRDLVGTIFCSLKTVSLAELASHEIGYHALSYAWGSPHAVRSIYLNDICDEVSHPRGEYRPFFVGQNLYQALEAISLEESQDDAWFWIDALCINQSDPVEKSSQLPYMIDIYNNAWSVHIWLGEEESIQRGDVTTGSLDFISTIINLRFIDQIAVNGKADEDVVRSLVTFAKLLRRSWFRRRWVIQEVSAAKRASVQCGNKKVSWVDFADAVQLLMANLDHIRALYRRSETFSWEPDALDHLESIGAGAIVYAATNTLRKTTDGRIITRAWDIERLVMTFSHFEASDPRDTIYALSSLASDGTSRARNTTSQTDNSSEVAKVDLIAQPSYHCSLIDVYVAFVRHCIKRNNSLNVICRHWALPAIKNIWNSDRLEREVSLPSWIGDISNSAFGSPSRPSGRINGESLVGRPGRHVYNASGGRIPRSEDVTDQSNDEFYTLHARGFVLGEVTLISPRTIEGTISHDSFQMLGWHKDSNVNNVSDLVWRILVADRTENGDPAPTWWRRACMWCLSNTTADGDLSTSKLLSTKTLPAMVHQYLRRVQAVVWNRRFFVCQPDPNEKPVFYGLGPRDLQVGDLCCILYGCSVPVLLRPLSVVEVGWSLVGESYVHGMMDREAVADVTEQNKCTFMIF